MRRHLTAAFVVTAACSGSTPTEKPVVPISEPSAPDSAERAPDTAPSTAPAPRPTTGTTNPGPTNPGPTNPVDSEGRTIMLAYNGDDRCFIYLPFPPLKPGELRPPGTAPPSVDVPCPPEMQSPAYRTCRGGIISHTPDGCECFEHGNPPRVSPNACP